MKFKTGMLIETKNKERFLFYEFVKINNLEFHNVFCSLESRRTTIIHLSEYDSVFLHEDSSKSIQEIYSPISYLAPHEVPIIQYSKAFRNLLWSRYVKFQLNESLTVVIENNRMRLDINSLVNLEITIDKLKELYDVAKKELSNKGIRT